MAAGNQPTKAETKPADNPKDTGNAPTKKVDPKAASTPAEQPAKKEFKDGTPAAAANNTNVTGGSDNKGGRSDRGAKDGRRGRGGAFRGNRGNDRRGGFQNRGDRDGGDNKMNNSRNQNMSSGGGGGSTSNLNTQKDFNYGNRGDRYNQGNDYNQSMNEANQGPREEKKFTGRCRLFVGNLTPELDDDDFKKMFLEYGDVSEVYLNKQKGFGFIRLDTRHNAEKAKMQLDGTVRKGRTLRVRFATHGAALKVRHLPPFVYNELLEDAFSKFGQVERAIVIVDDRGRPSGEGIVEFARKPGAQKAMTSINDGVFLLGSSPRPIIVEPLEQKDEEDGLPEKYIQRNPVFGKERDQPPRFANPKSFEYEFGQRWKQLYEMEHKEKERLQKEMEDAVDKLEMEMSNAMHEQQANLLRQELQRLEEQRAADEMKRREMTLRRQEEERVRREEEDALRQQRLMRQQQQEEQFRRRNMGRQDMMRQQQDMMDERKFGGSQEDRMAGRQMQDRTGGRGGGRENNMRGDRQGNQRENLSGGVGGGQRDGVGGGQRDGVGGGQRDQSQGQDMEMRRGGGGAESTNAAPMQPPPALPVGFNLNREREQELGGMSPAGNAGNNMSESRGGGVGNNSNLRTSRFDQLPNANFNQRQMGGMGGNNMGSNMGNMSGGMGMGNVRDRSMMDRRDRRDDFEAKRPRHF